MKLRIAYNLGYMISLTKSTPLVSTTWTIVVHTSAVSCLKSSDNSSLVSPQRPRTAQPSSLPSSSTILENLRWIQDHAKKKKPQRIRIETWSQMNSLEQKCAQEHLQTLIRSMARIGLRIQSKDCILMDYHYITILWRVILMLYTRKWRENQKEKAAQKRRQPVQLYYSRRNKKHCRPVLTSHEKSYGWYNGKMLYW